MSRALAASAKRLGCSEGTLRRYANDGLLRGHRVARGRLELSRAEEHYLSRHWHLLSSLRTTLRAEACVSVSTRYLRPPRVKSERRRSARARRLRQHRERIAARRDEARRLAADPDDRVELAKLRNDFDELTPVWPAD